MRENIAGLTSGDSIPGADPGEDKKKAAGKKKKKKAAGKKKKKTELKEGQVEVEYTDKAIISLLNLPFDIAAVKTGYQQRIPQEMHEQLSTSAQACLEEFGAADVGKWIHLGVFGASYATCIVMWFQGFRADQKMKLEAWEKAQKADATVRDHAPHVHRGEEKKDVGNE